MDYELELVKKISNKLQLDLTGKVVLTEIGTGAFGYIGLIAAFNNAKKVICWTKDSEYGKAKNNIKWLLDKVIAWNLTDIEFEFSILEKPIEHIKAADIITNSGFTRPFNKDFLKNMNNKAVIALMMEAWEFRESDIDLDYARQKNISIGGTWENHPSLKIFDQCGPLAAKLIKDSGFELNRNKVLIISSDNFGLITQNELETKYNCKTTIAHPKDIEEFRPENYELIFLADFSYIKDIISVENSFLKKTINTKLPIVHLSGQIDCEFATKKGYQIYPNINGFPKKMTKTLAYLGTKPVIELHAAGLKVGELIHNNKTDSLAQTL
jgi:hypothetical protein